MGRTGAWSWRIPRGRRGPRAAAARVAGPGRCPRICGSHRVNSVSRMIARPPWATCAASAAEPRARCAAAMISRITAARLPSSGDRRASRASAVCWASSNLPVLRQVVMRKVSNRSWFRNFAQGRSSSGSATAERLLGLAPGFQRLLLVAHDRAFFRVPGGDPGGRGRRGLDGDVVQGLGQQDAGAAVGAFGAGDVAAVGQGARGHGRVAGLLGGLDGGVVQVPGGAGVAEAGRRTSRPAGCSPPPRRSGGGAVRRPGRRRSRRAGC